MVGRQSARSVNCKYTSKRGDFNSTHDEILFSVSGQRSSHLASRITSPLKTLTKQKGENRRQLGGSMGLSSISTNKRMNEASFPTVFPGLWIST